MEAPFLCQCCNQTRSYEDRFEGHVYLAEELKTGKSGLDFFDDVNLYGGSKEFVVVYLCAGCIRKDVRNAWLVLLVFLGLGITLISLEKPLGMSGWGYATGTIFIFIFLGGLIKFWLYETDVMDTRARGILYRKIRKEMGNSKKIQLFTRKEHKKLYHIKH